MELEGMLETPRRSRQPDAGLAAQARCPLCRGPLAVRLDCRGPYFACLCQPRRRKVTPA
jgi:hypothetical protein